MDEDSVANRRAWDEASDAYQSLHSEQLGTNPEGWGIWSLPEAELQLIGLVEGRDVLDYGCGAAHWSVALAGRGARVTALDNSARQLAYARDVVAGSGLNVTLVHACGESTPFPDASFDIVFSDRGTMVFADPERTIPEAARILRPGGVFAFSLEHPLHALTGDDVSQRPSRALNRPYFSLGRVEFSAGGVAYVRTVSDIVTLLIAHGFTIEKLLEPRPAADATTTYAGFTSLEWARDFPAELMIRARRT